MAKFIRINKKFCLLALSICLLITCNGTYAFFKKASWFHLSHEEISFWEKLSKDFDIKCDENNPIVQKHIRWYQQHPKHLRRILIGSQPFIHYVYEQTHRKNLPAELALIPMLESQYNPAIGAKSGAAGLWQMMPGTAIKFGLKINHSYDGRRDVTASTKAALTYLNYLYHYFNRDWLLALAAYDAGEGKIQAMAGRYNHNFWLLPLSRETKEYIPKLLAIASIIKQPQQYQVALPSIPNKASLQEITWNEAKVINLSEAAKTLGVEDHIIKRYNPGIRKNIANVPSSLTLLVPGTELDSQALPIPPAVQIGQKLGNQKRTKAKVQHYKIRKGDTISSIAKRFHMPAKQLKKINAIKNDKNLKVGKKLTIPMPLPTSLADDKEPL